MVFFCRTKPRPFARHVDDLDLSWSHSVAVVWNNFTLELQIFIARSAPKICFTPRFKNQDVGMFGIHGKGILGR